MDEIHPRWRLGAAAAMGQRCSVAAPWGAGRGNAAVPGAMSRARAQLWQSLARPGGWEHHRSIAGSKCGIFQHAQGKASIWGVENLIILMVLSHILRRILEHWLQMDRLHLQQVNLLITEEGWGLSSANWLIKHSAWSVKFLHDALTAAHVELQLFGDQDAMILHLMNRIFFAAKSKVLSSKFSKVSVLINFLCFHFSKPTENVYILYIYIYFIFRFRFTVGPPLLPRSVAGSRAAASGGEGSAGPPRRHHSSVWTQRLRRLERPDHGVWCLRGRRFVGDLPAVQRCWGMWPGSGRCFVVKVAVAFTYWVVVEKLAHSLKSNKWWEHLGPGCCGSPQTASEAPRLAMKV